LQRSWIESLAPHNLQSLKTLTDEEAAALIFDWPKWARPAQLLPDGDWDGWLILAGRGWGKTRCGAEAIRAEVEAGRAQRIGLVAETAADGRNVIVEGESGILATSPPWNRPLYEPSKRRLTWPNGAIAILYDACQPDQLRGPQHDLILFDELAKYRYADAVFDNAMFGLRLSLHPRWIATTTPRPISLIRKLLTAKTVAVTRGRSDDNLANLSPSYQRNVIERYRGTRLGRQELDAEVLDDVPGALWSRRVLDEGRVIKTPVLSRVIVGIDPAATAGEDSDETGIIVCGVAADGNAYVIADCSVRASPGEWARKAVAAYRLHRADLIVAEANQGGDMVAAVIRSVLPDAPVKLVRATRGKYVRAEPASALYEQGRIRHAGVFPDLEDQMTGFTPSRAGDGRSPDRVDALVWALTELFPDVIAAGDERELDTGGHYSGGWMS
jgi:phage terminase large subunit-like protein